MLAIYILALFTMYIAPSALTEHGARGRVLRKPYFNVKWGVGCCSTLIEMRSNIYDCRIILYSTARGARVDVYSLVVLFITPGNQGF